MFLITGLGNPGREYKNTRHNIGFLQVDALAATLGTRFSRVESKALVTKASYQGRRLILAKPQTYMNLSGQAVAALVRFYKIPLENILIVYDEVDLPFGILRLRPKGGSAGHKGIRSILERLGTQEIPRLRIGVDRPPGRMDAAAYVLQDFTRAEHDELPQILQIGVEAIQTFLAEGLEAAMTRYNGQAIDESNS
ncbi:MAG: aminoacyl-tRNA hydrolase [Anaerolineales bacterium]